MSKEVSTTNTEQAAINLCKESESRSHSFIPSIIGRAYEGFLELPVQVVLLVLWVAGIVFFGACALLAYMGISALVELVAGVI